MGGKGRRAYNTGYDNYIGWAFVLIGFGIVFFISVFFYSPTSQ